MIVFYLYTHRWLVQGWGAWWVQIWKQNDCSFSSNSVRRVLVIKELEVIRDHQNPTFHKVVLIIDWCDWLVCDSQENRGSFSGHTGWDCSEGRCPGNPPRTGRAGQRNEPGGTSRSHPLSPVEGNWDTWQEGRSVTCNHSIPFYLGTNHLLRAKRETYLLWMR